MVVCLRCGNWRFMEKSLRLFLAENCDECVNADGTLKRLK